MAHRNSRIILLSLIGLTAIIVSACTQPYSQVPLASATPISTGVFVSPFPTSDNPMAMVEEYATGTAVAQTAVALTAGTPLAQADTPDTIITVTVTDTVPGVVCTPPACAAGETLVCPPGSTCTGGCGVVCTANTPIPSNTPDLPPASSAASCGSSYTLQSGEFPFCIARRCNVDPAELLALNGLASGDIYYPNLTLKIPQSGKPFPGTRALNAHPATFTVGVTSGADTIYGVACYYGDVDPAGIAQRNGIAVNSQLTSGQQLQIP